MKNLFLCAILALSARSLHAQTANVNWGDDFKMHKGSTDLSVVYADKTGVFVKEGHMALKGYFVIAATTRESATLVKLDNSFTEEYHNDFNKELKGKEFEDFFFIADKAYIFATSYSKKEHTLTLYAAAIDKGNGKPDGDWNEVTTWQKDEKSDALDFKISYNTDSTKMLLISTDEGRDQSKYEIREFDSKLAAVGKPVTISTEFDPHTFQLEDVITTAGGNIVIVGRQYAYADGKKKKEKNLEFENYVVRLYNSAGASIKEINTDINGKWLVSTKVAQVPNHDLVLAAFYADAKKGKEINGMLVQRIDPATGEVISTGKQELSTSMITAVDDADDDNDDNDESKKERKEREKLEKIQNDDDGFSRYLQFRNFVYTEDHGIVILAEKYHHYTYTTTSSNYGSGPGYHGTTTTTYAVYDCDDLMMSKMDAAGKLVWVHVLPKRQHEVIQIGSSSNGGGSGFSVGSSYFGSYNYPFYAGLGSITLPGKNTIAILFNDSPKNDNVLQLGQKVKTATRFGKTDCFAVFLDAGSGKYKRVSIFSNHDQPTAMVRFGVPIGKDYYLIGKDDKAIGKSKIAVGSIVFK